MRSCCSSVRFCSWCRWCFLPCLIRPVHCRLRGRLRCGGATNSVRFAYTRMHACADHTGQHLFTPHLSSRATRHQHADDQHANASTNVDDVHINIININCYIISDIFHHAHPPTSTAINHNWDNDRPAERSVQPSKRDPGRQPRASHRSTCVLRH